MPPPEEHLRSTKPRILLFAPILEYPPMGGPQIRAFNGVKALEAVSSELHIITPQHREQLGPEGALAVLSGHCSSLVFAPSARLAVKHKLAATAIRKARRLAARMIAKVDAAFIDRYADEHDIDIFWMDRVLDYSFEVLMELRARRPAAKIVADTDAVWSRFVLRQLPFVGSGLRRAIIGARGRRKQRQERQLADLADVVTAVSDIDADYFRRMTNNSERIERFSNVIDIADYLKPVTPLPEVHRPGLLLLGSFGRQGSPMDRAAVWTAQEIMPKVWQRVPAAHLYIIGRNANLTQASLQNDRVTVIGQIPSVVGYLQQAAATLVPLLYESGTRFKILESGALSIPCVSTTLGAEGLTVANGHDIMLADTTNDFADAIVAILKNCDLARSLAANLHDLVTRDYSLASQIREGEKIVAGLMGRAE